jgi:hypothetical protein
MFKRGGIERFEVAKAFAIFARQAMQCIFSK